MKPLTNPFFVVFFLLISSVCAQTIPASDTLGSSPRGLRGGTNLTIPDRSDPIIILTDTPRVDTSISDTQGLKDSEKDSKGMNSLPDSTEQDSIQVISGRKNFLKSKNKQKESGSSQDSTVQSRPPYQPQKALWKSAVVPGWGQIYNRSYWKAPIVWAGLGGITYGIVLEHKFYKEAQRTYRCRFDTSCSFNPSPYDNYTDSSVRTLRDRYRRNRDLLYIVAVAWWGLNVLDAYVEAHLKDFRVSGDLSMKIKPKMILANTPGPPGLGMSINMTFR